MSGWPRLSETFAQNELIALRRAGMLAAVVATKPGDDALVQPGLDELDDLVVELPAPPDGATPAEQAAFHADALVGFVGSLDAPVDAVHGYFAHHPAAVAHAAARRLGVAFGFSVHALDVRKVDADELRARAADAAIVATCNADALAVLVGTGIAATLVPHGVDISRFSPGDGAPTDTSVADVDVIAVGRLVEKKGFPTLLAAIAATGADGPRLTILGDGPDRPALMEQVDALGIGARVRLAGRVTHADLPEHYRRADIVVVPSVVDHNGDRDGLPNVVLEAMASGCAIVASDVAAIASAIDGVTNGVLVPPGDAAALGAAIADLAADPTRRGRLGAAARRTAVERYELGVCGSAWCDVLTAAYPVVAR